MSLTNQDLESIKTRLRKACKMVHDLCLPLGYENARRWEMSIPARPDSDPDLVIHASLDDLKRLLGQVERLMKIFPTRNDGDGVTQEDWDQLQQENSRLRATRDSALKGEHENFEESQRYRTALEDLANGRGVGMVFPKEKEVNGEIVGVAYQEYAKEVLLPREGK